MSVSDDAPRVPPVRISVVTVCFDAVATIEETVRSVRSQRGADVEYVVVDGASSDGTLDVLQRYRSDIDVLVSEKDNGIFDAMNKGIARSTGDVLYFLGADDSLVDDRVLADVAAAFAADPTRLIVYGNVVFRGAPDGRRYGPAKPFRTWTIREFLDNSFCHQALFARRSLFTDVGLFDDRFRYSADYEWVIKVFRHRPRGFHYLDRLIANYNFQGLSYTQGDTTRREVRKHYFKHLMSVDMLWYFFRFVLLRGWRKKLSGRP